MATDKSVSNCLIKAKSGQYDVICTLSVSRMIPLGKVQLLHSSGPEMATLPSVFISSLFKTTWHLRMDSKGRRVVKDVDLIGSTELSQLGQVKVKSDKTER